MGNDEKSNGTTSRSGRKNGAADRMDPPGIRPKAEQPGAYGIRKPSGSGKMQKAEDKDKCADAKKNGAAAADAATGEREAEVSRLRWIGTGRFRWLRPANWLIGLIAVYKSAISPWLPPACRFEPSCSMYAMEALRVHGLFRGSWLAIRRLLRCNPFCEGGYDPVPPKNNGNRQTASGSGKMWRNK